MSGAELRLQIGLLASRIPPISRGSFPVLGRPRPIIGRFQPEPEELLGDRRVGVVKGIGQRPDPRIPLTPGVVTGPRKVVKMRRGLFTVAGGQCMRSRAGESGDARRLPAEAESRVRAFTCRAASCIA
jgi:hypothetical protein